MIRTSFYGYIYILCIFSISLAAAAENTDSLVYRLKYDELITLYGNDSAFQIYFSTAQDYAKVKLFREAYSLLTDYFENDTLFPYTRLLRARDSSAGAAASDSTVEKYKKQQKNLTLRFIFYNSFRNMEDIARIFIDTSQDDLIDTNYYTSNMVDYKVSAEWKGRGRYVKKIMPWLSLTDTWIRCGNDMSLAFFKDHFSLVHTLELEKRVANDSLDGVSSALHAKVLANSYTRNRSYVFSYALHGYVELEKYRYVMDYYKSFSGFEIKPEFAVESSDFSKTGSVNWEYGYRNYDTYLGTEDDKHWYGPSLDFNIWSSHFDCTGFASYVWQYFPFWNKTPSNTDPGRSQYGFFDAWLSYPAFSWLSIGLSTGYQRYSEFFPLYTILVYDSLLNWWFPDTVSSVSFLSHSIQVRPGVSVKLPKDFSIAIHCLLEKQTAYAKTTEQYNIVYQGMPFSIFEALVPNLQFSLSRNKVSLELGCDYRIAHVTKDFFAYGNYYDEIKPYIYCRVYPLTWMDISTRIEYQWLQYRGKDIRSKSAYVSLSLRTEF